MFALYNIFLYTLPDGAIQHLHNCGCDISIKSRYVPAVAKHCSQLDRDVIRPLTQCNLQFATSVKLLEVVACYRLCAARWSRFTLHKGTQTIGDAFVFACKPRVHARKHSMNRRSKSALATSSRFLVCDFDVCFISLVYCLPKTRVFASIEFLTHS